MEAGSSSKKRIRFPTISSGDEESDDNTRYGFLLDIDLLNCPVCFEAFTTPIYQCDNGHLACASCSKKLKNKCSTCTLLIGTIPCRAIEKMVESIVVQCPNFKHGCKEILSSKDRKTHEEKCVFFQCSCPLPNCNYTGTFEDLYRHFNSTHKDNARLSNNLFRYREPYVVSMHITDKMCVLMETYDSLLFVVQCFDEPYGVCVTVKCIAPFSHEVGDFSYSLSLGYGDRLKSEFPTLKKVQEVRFETPKEDFMLIPSYLMRRNGGRLILTVEIDKW